MWATFRQECGAGWSSEQSDSQAQVQIMKMLYVFIVVLVNLHLYLMEENSPGISTVF